MTFNDLWWQHAIATALIDTYPPVRLAPDAPHGVNSEDEQC